MKYASITDRLSDLGSAKWAIHQKARALRAEGEKLIELTIGEPDVPTPAPLVDAARRALDAGRTGYSNGRGEAALLDALSARYTLRTGRAISRQQFICLPGTQTCLYAALMAMTDAGDEVIVGDPMYATYQGVIAATGAVAVPVPLRRERGFRLDAADIASKITARTRVIFLNSPHNPTGAILTRADLVAIGALAQRHDLWILSDEVYEEMVFEGSTFTSALALPELAERVVVTASISKSHAAPGFRSGWCVGSEEFIERLLPVAETMLFGNQPFIADMTALAVSEPSSVARGMADRFSRRADLLVRELDGVAGLRVHRPEAGMFALIDISATGMSGNEFAHSLLEAERVAVMPGESFGDALAGWLRVALSQPDELILEACHRIAAHVQKLRKAA